MLRAPDLALTQILIETVTVILFFSGLSLLAPTDALSPLEAEFGLRWALSHVSRSDGFHHLTRRADPHR